MLLVLDTCYAVICHHQHSLLLLLVGGSEVLVVDPAKKEELRQALMERHRREVEEEAAGINALLFEHVDGDKNGTIELDGLASLIHIHISTCICMNVSSYCILNQDVRTTTTIYL